MKIGIFLLVKKNLFISSERKKLSEAITDITGILYEFLRKNSDPHPVKIDPNPVQKNVLLFSYLEKPLQVVNLAQSHGHEYQGLK